MTYWVYILASRRNGKLYVGHTKYLERRVGQHKAGRGARFTRTYAVRTLVHAEEFGSKVRAVLREKRLKSWRRARKIALIERDNPTWRDLDKATNG